MKRRKTAATDRVSLFYPVICCFKVFLEAAHPFQSRSSPPLGRKVADTAVVKLQIICSGSRPQKRGKGEGRHKD
jgi:hypothetical protein